MRTVSSRHKCRSQSKASRTLHPFIAVQQILTESGSELESLNARPRETRTNMSTRAEAKATVGDISNDGDLNTAQTQISRKGFCSVRHGMAFILQLCNFSILTQQMNLSITIPAMVNNTALPSLPNASTERPPTGSPNPWNETRQAPEAVAPVYDWSPEIQGVLLSSLNYGSLLASVPAGYLVGVFGIRYLVGAAVLISSVLNLFIPLAADAGVALLIVLRTVQGIAQVPRHFLSMSGI